MRVALPKPAISTASRQDGIVVPNREVVGAVNAHWTVAMATPILMNSKSAGVETPVDMRARTGAQRMHLAR